MIKKNKVTLLITSIITLLPIIAGVIMWNDLPDTIATHWGVDNEPNGFMAKPFAVFGLPFMMLALHWVCIFFTAFDKKQANQNPKIITMVLWIIPSISVILSALTYTYAMGKKINIGLFALLIGGILFVAIGNYLPKCKQNYSIGVRLPWTFSDTENWNKTNRFTGVVWVIGGLIIIFTSPLTSPIIFITVILAITLIPTIYSFLLSKHKTENDD